MLQFIEWGRPAGLWLLLLPLLVLLLARFFSRPTTRVTGTLPIWKSVAAASAARGQRRSLRLPLSLWLLLLGLTAGALALGDPRAPLQAAPRSIVCLVDSSPSMYLPEGATTRLAAALEVVGRWLNENEIEHERRTWKRHVRGRLESFVGSAPPTDWLDAPRIPQVEPRWHESDEPGLLWVTDAPTGVLAKHALEYASGGASVSGTIATAGDVRYDWDGTSVLAIEGGAPRGRVLLADAVRERLFSQLRDFVSLWARDRGLEVLGAASPDEVELVFRVPEGELRDCALGRDGWSFEGQAVPLPVSVDPSEAWLGQSDAIFVRSRPGLVECGLERCTSLSGDAPAFAISWGELLDGALLPVPGVVALSERQAAGEAAWRFPPGKNESDVGVAQGTSVDSLLGAGLASLAFLATLLSLLARAGFRR